MKRRDLALLAGATAIGVILAVAVTMAAATPKPSAESATEATIALPALSNMSSLASAPTPADTTLETTLAKEDAALTADDAAVPDEMAPGVPVAGSFRVLLRDLGTQHRVIYAFTTSKSRVCGGITDGASGCFDRFASGQVNYFVGALVGEPVIVFGFLPNDAHSVDVVAAGQHYPAIVGRNAFFLQLPDPTLPATQVESVNVTLTNGQSLVTDASLSRTPQAAPTP